MGSEDAELLKADQVETYCGWPVVTKVDGKMVTREYECDEGGSSIKLTMKWRVTVSRMRVDSGELERVLRGRAYAEAWMGNEKLYDFMLGNIDYAANFTVLGYVGTKGGASPPSIPGPSEAATSSGATDILMQITAFGCAGVGSSVVTLLDEYLWQMWRSGAAAAVDSSGEYVGSTAVDVSHVLYLLKNSPVLRDCGEWIEEICRRCPIDCDDKGPPVDPRDFDPPVLVVGA